MSLNKEVQQAGVLKLRIPMWVYEMQDNMPTQQHSGVTNPHVGL